jgi:hypothetical protein
VPNTPADRSGCVYRLLPRPRGLPRNEGGSASALGLSGPARTSLTLRPAELLDRPRRPLSRGFNPGGCPSRPLVSYRINRQLPGWLLPPLATHAYRAHFIRSPRRREDHRADSHQFCALSRVSTIFFASATIASLGLFSSLAGLSDSADDEPGGKIIALQPFPTGLTSRRYPL